MNRKKDPLTEEFDEVYLKYRALLLQYIIATVQDRNIAEDILQETFYVAIRRKEIFREHSCKFGWLCQTANYKMKEYHRKMGSYTEISVESDKIEKCDLEEGYSKTEMEMVLYENLTQEEILRFRRYFLWGETTEEIAKKENVTENNMRVRISRLKLKIESILREA